MFTRWGVLLVVFLATLAGHCDAAMTLRHLSTRYFPKQYEPSEVYELDSGPVEQIAFDPSPEQYYLYIAGIFHLTVLDYSDPTNPETVHLISVEHEIGIGELTDIDSCGTYVAATFGDLDDSRRGRVLVWTTYDPASQDGMTLLHDIEVGTGPDSLAFTSDCLNLAAALEGEVLIDNGRVVDPDGGVAIINFSPDPSGVATLKQADFNKFNDDLDDYRAIGVRYVFDGSAAGYEATFAQDIEPEVLTISDDNTLVYVGLQPNNAIATVDIATAEVLELYPLGVQDWANLQGIDASDEDDGIHRRKWPIFGMRLPDGIKFARVNGQGYIFTGNEGNDKEYEFDELEWSEMSRGKHFDRDDWLSDNLSDEMVEWLDNDDELGRLYFSVVDGLDNEGKVETLYTYGGRSFSIFRADDLSLAYDSGGEIEELIERYYPWVFNANPRNSEDSPEQTIDRRSDNRGPQTESVELGEVDGQTVLFVGSERPGIIVVYTIPPDTASPEPQFESIHYHGGGGKSWFELYDNRETWDLAPEDMKFLPADRSPINVPLLAVAGTQSGTVAFYEVYDNAPCACAEGSRVAEPANNRAKQENTKR